MGTTTYEQFRNALTRAFSRKALGIAMSDAEGVRVARDPALSRAYYDNWLARKERVPADFQDRAKKAGGTIQRLRRSAAAGVDIAADIWSLDDAEVRAIAYILLNPSTTNSARATSIPRSTVSAGNAAPRSAPPAASAVPASANAVLNSSPSEGVPSQHSVRMWPAVVGLVLAMVGYFLSYTWFSAIGLVGLGFAIFSIIDARSQRPQPGWKAAFVLGIVGTVVGGVSALLLLAALAGYRSS